MRSNSCILFLLLVLGGVFCAQLPSSVPRCYRNDPKLHECLLKATETIRPLLVAGNKDIGIDGIEPYVLPELVIEQGTQTHSFKMSLKNFTLHGLSSYKFETWEFDPETFIFTSKATMGPINTTSECTVDGKILLVNLNGKGTLLSGIGPSSFVSVVHTNLVKRNGVDYIDIKNVSVDLNYDNAWARLENFEGAKPELINAINRAIADNNLLKEFSGTLQYFIRDFVIQIFGNLTKKFSYDQVFPMMS